MRLMQLAAATLILAPAAVDSLGESEQALVDADEYRIGLYCACVSGFIEFDRSGFKGLQRFR